MTGEQPVQRRDRREDRQLPGRRRRAADPAHADGRPAAHADVHDVPEAGLLLLDHRRRTCRSTAAFAWDHGYYSPNIDVTWSSFAGPGVAARGVDGPTPEQSNEAAGPELDRTVPEARGAGRGSRRSTCVRPCCGCSDCSDDYPTDGESSPRCWPTPRAARHRGAGCGRTRRSTPSVGPLATATLIADSLALAGGSPGHDRQYAATEAALTRIADQRDRLATQMKAGAGPRGRRHSLSRGASAARMDVRRAPAAERPPSSARAVSPPAGVRP